MPVKPRFTGSSFVASRPRFRSVRRVAPSEAARRIVFSCSILVVAVLLLVGARPADAQTPPAAVVHYKIKLGTDDVLVVRVNLRDPRITVAPAVAPHVKASLHDLVLHFHPVAAINGTFFDTRTWRITGNIVQQGHLIHEGYIGNTLAFTHDNQPVLLHNSHRMGRHTDWTPYTTAIGGGPTLLAGGRVCLDPRAEGFKDPGLFRFARRSAVGFTHSGILLLVNVQTPVSFHELTRIMLQLGASDAVSLDGGSSSGLYCNGDVLSEPRRPLTNLLAVYEHPVAVARRSNSGQKLVMQAVYLLGGSSLLVGKLAPTPVKASAPAPPKPARHRAPEASARTASRTRLRVAVRKRTT